MIEAGDPQFREAVHGNLWNRLSPDRAPRMIAKVADEGDIVLP
ncbi:hypothetical protein ACU4GR_25690 [Methylobacterium oryzae CBMB20]